MNLNNQLTYYEFFAGGGMARAGLGGNWDCLFANDFDQCKANTYQINWGGEHFLCADVAAVTTENLRAHASLSWASFPCQDLSLAGSGAGLGGERSGTFWAFWQLMKDLGREGRSPKFIVLENVLGALHSHGGRDFAAIGDAISESGYRFGAMIIDGVRFVPQSRPRLFIVCSHVSQKLPTDKTRSTPNPNWHPKALIEAYTRLGENARSNWVWWQLDTPPARKIELSDLIENDPHGVDWHTEVQTNALLSMMTTTNRDKVDWAMKQNRRMVGGIYKRTRQGVQRAEVRFDVAGCLRTPAGGSSRQTILIIDGKDVKSRLLSPREAARLMGLPDTYALPARYNDAYHLAGDGLVVPVVRFLAENLLEPVLMQSEDVPHHQVAA